LRGGEKLQVNQATNEIVSENGWTCSIACKEWQKWRNSLIGEVLECIDAVFGLSIPYLYLGIQKYVEVSRFVQTEGELFASQLGYLHAQAN
jgi:hypothetical protein